MFLWFNLAVIIFAATLLIDVYTDIKRWKKGVVTDDVKISHIRGALLRSFGLAPVIFILGWQSIPAVGFLYWFLFDGLFNHIRGFNWWFTGSDDKNDAKTDDFLQSISLTKQKWIKIGGTIISVILYIILSVK